MVAVQTPLTMIAARWGMSCYVRPKVTGARVFFTVGLAWRGSSVLVDEIEHLREAVRVTRAERPFEIDAFVVLPDHIHAVWTMPRGDRDYGVRWGAIKARFSASIRRAGFTPPPRLPVVKTGRYAGVNPGLRHDKGDAGIWQRRFWEHHIRNEADYWMHVRYCWLNPVKHGLVSRPEEWPYSSVHRNARFEVGMELGVSGAISSRHFGTQLIESGGVQLHLTLVIMTNDQGIYSLWLLCIRATLLIK